MKNFHSPKSFSNYITKLNPAVVISSMVIISFLLVFGTVFILSSRDNENSQNNTKDQSQNSLQGLQTFSFAESSSSVFDETISYEGSIFDPKNTIFENFIKNQSFSQFSNITTELGLEADLNSNDKLTLFLPENPSFDKADPESITFLLNPENREQLKKTIKHHVVVGEIYKKDLIGGSRLLTLEGSYLEVSTNENLYKINDSEIKTFDLPARNGVIHVVKDLVLLPQEALDLN